MKSEDNRSIGLSEVVAIGIGGMVGGGIFAVLGLAVQLAEGGTPLAFAIAGAVALVTAYSYARLSVTFPSQGGTITFLNKAFGTGLSTGSLNMLLWISYVVMLSLYAYAFGSYGSTFFPEAVRPFWEHVLISASVITIAGLNVLGAKVIGQAEDLIVGIKVAILLLFIALGIRGIDTAYLEPATWSPFTSLVAGGMIIFVAYEGFELIANAAEDVRNPRKNLPRAYFTAVIFVIALYVAIAIVTVGTLPVDQIVAARDYALAEAARPFMGQAGFALIAVAAMLSTTSAINATFYGASRISYIIAKDGELPASLERKIWNRPLEGLFITTGATLLLANSLDLSSISAMGSTGFLLIFAAVNLANYRMAEQTESNRYLPMLGFAGCVGAFAAIIWYVIQNDPARIGVLAGMLGLAVAIEWVYRATLPEKQSQLV